LYRKEADVAHFEMLTLWDDIDAIERFAGNDFNLAKYYDFDSDFLIEKEARVQHYDVTSDNSPDRCGRTQGLSQGGETMVARVWQGVAAVENAEAYFRYLVDFGFRDYRTHPGSRGAHLLRQTGDARVCFLLLSFWTSLQAIVAYAGSDIDKAHYYAYDLECLIDPPSSVEHYEVLSGDTLAES
jgi:heme-degrading monooxygenase HmoA